MHNKIRINSPSTAFSSENLSENAASVICKIFSPKAISSRIGTFVVNTQKFKALCLQSSDYIFKQILNYIFSKLGFRSRPYISKCFYEKMPLVPYLLFQAVSMNRYFVDHILHIFYVCHY